MAPALDVVLVAVGVAYPFLVYFGLRVLPPGVIAIVLVPIFALRLVLVRNQSGRSTLPYLIAAVVVLMVAVRSPIIGLKAYPVMLSLALAAAFAYSLIWPPTVIEQIARIRHPELPLEVNTYLRKVTIAWLMFFIANAAISAATAMSGSMRLWTLYNGFISYLAIGAMFAAELLIRQTVHRRIRRRA